MARMLGRAPIFKPITSISRMVREEAPVDLVVSGEDLLSLVVAFLAVERAQQVALLGHPVAHDHAGVNPTLHWTGLLQGQEGGFEPALRNRTLLYKMAATIGYRPAGKGVLLPAYHVRELALLEELALAIGSFDRKLSLLTPEQTIGLSAFLNPVRLEGSLLVPGELVLEVESFCAQAYHYLRQHPRVRTYPSVQPLQWQDSYLRGPDLRLPARKVFLRSLGSDPGLSNSERPRRIQREVVIPGQNQSRGPSVQLGWVQSPPPAFSVLKTYAGLLEEGYYHQPPGQLHLLPAADNRLLLHQEGLPGDPGEERLFAALRKTLRHFPEEEVNWPAFWQSEHALAFSGPSLPTFSSHVRRMSSASPMEGSAFPFPFAERFLSQQGPGLFRR